jgi:hypothetical protein
MSSERPKHALFLQFAAVAKAASQAHRLGILEILAQSERSVEAVAERASLSVVNASQRLRRAGFGDRPQGGQAGPVPPERRRGGHGARRAAPHCGTSRRSSAAGVEGRRLADAGRVSAATARLQSPKAFRFNGPMPAHSVRDHIARWQEHTPLVAPVRGGDCLDASDTATSACAVSRPPGCNNSFAAASTGMELCDRRPD